MAMSAKNIIKRSLLILSVPVIIAAWFVANHMGKNNPLQDVKITIIKNSGEQFITESEMFAQLITNKNIVVKATSIKNVNVKEIEAIAKNNPWVHSVEVFVSNNGVLNINITQREPVLRLLSESGSHYYLDSAVAIIPLKTENSMDVPVVTVNDIGMSVADQNIKAQAVALCGYIKKDSFWNAMISQVSINDNREFELITSIAEHTILFGDTTSMADKFNRLFLFYREAIPKIGYDAYSVLNVKNVGQIVGVKGQLESAIQATDNSSVAKQSTTNINKSISKMALTSNQNVAKRSSTLASNTKPKSIKASVSAKTIKTNTTKVITKVETKKKEIKKTEVKKKIVIAKPKLPNKINTNSN
jgi:cell division protein FtsQ